MYLFCIIKLINNCLIMKLFGITFKFLTFLIVVILLSKAKLTKVEEYLQGTNLDLNTEENTTEIEKKMTDEQKKTFQNKPSAPKEIPMDLRFMQKELSKAYKLASNQNNPRFIEAESMNQKFMSLFPEDKREVGVPLKREG